ncbi:MAG: hypothetical protein ACRDNS_30420 [Trebonia sp.]
MARATQQAAARIAVRPGADNDLRFTTAAGHCGEAADEIQRLYPHVFTCVAVPTLADDLDRLSTCDAGERLLDTIAGAFGDFDLDSPDLSPRAVLAAGSAASWLALAHHVIGGRLP